MTSKTITDRAGDTLRLSTGSLTAGPGEITLKVTERFRGREAVAAVHVDPRELRAALDEVAPAGSYARTNEDWKARAEKAERERDEARDAASAALAAWEARERFRTAESRPLTLDAITDEMIRRVRDRMHERGMGFLSSYSIRELLIVALTEPPTRPEGAEEWEDWLIEALPHESMPDEDIARLADQIAARAARRDEEDR